MITIQRRVSTRGSFPKVVGPKGRGHPAVPGAAGVFPPPPSSGQSFRAAASGPSRQAEPHAPPRVSPTTFAGVEHRPAERPAEGGTKGLHEGRHNRIVQHGP